LHETLRLAKMRLRANLGPVGMRCYHAGVSVEKLSVALDELVARAARQAAERQGISLSAWLTEASRNALAIEDGLIAVAEWEAEHGPLAPADLFAADAALDKVRVDRAA
jgi:hypothetical protein